MTTELHSNLVFSWNLFGEGDWLIPIVVICITGLFFFIFLLRSSKSFPYEKNECLCSKTELKFYQQLCEIVDGRYEIFMKTRISDLLEVKKGTRKPISWQNQIHAQHVDFVLCSPRSLKILVAIELEDQSHDPEERGKRDQFINQAFETARMAIIRIKTSDEYDHPKIEKAIAQGVNKRNKNFVIQVD